MACVAIVGAGPAGLMAAETLAARGHSVVVFEQMPSVARKFLMAGRGGLNLTNTADLGTFLARYGASSDPIAKAVQAYTPDALIDWCHGLGIATFVGSSGRVFPNALKASPLLRAWLERLRAMDVVVRTRHRVMGLSANSQDDLSPIAVQFRVVSRGDAPAAEPCVERFDAVILAAGGASWPRLGSDGCWTQLFGGDDVTILPFQPSNCGVLIDWSPALLTRFAGSPLKRIAVGCDGQVHRGDVVITRRGLEGGPIYALAPVFRDKLASGSPVSLWVDLRPDLSVDALTQRLSKPRAKQSTATFLRKAAGLHPVQIALLREGATGAGLPSDASDLARCIKAVPVSGRGLDGLERAISSVGGLAVCALDQRFMVRTRPGVFAAGEMLDWDAPTGGYLLQACFATGRAAALGVDDWFNCRGAGPARPVHQASR